MVRGHARAIATPRERSDAQPGRLGVYRLYEKLGSGGQARVYRARRIGDPAAPDVAVKRLHPHLTDDEDAVRSFGREARIAYLLDHPVIRRVYALCREPGELFMVMEYVDGVSLYELLRRVNLARRHLPLQGTLAVLHRLCDALHYAHELTDERGEPAGIVHRDVSPSNLIVTAAGRLKLIDLGIARSQSSEHATSSGLVKGKYGYMAPEVMRNAAFDRRADVFSVGVVAWELLTASRLYPVGNSPVDLERVRARPIERPSGRNASCPPELDEVVLRALATDPAERWPTCAAMAEALRDIAARLDEPLDDRAIAELVEVSGELDEAGVPGRADRPASLTMQVRPEGPEPERRCGRCRRTFALGAVGGSLATLVVALLAGVALQASAHEVADPGVVAARASEDPEPPAAADDAGAEPPAPADAAPPPPAEPAPFSVGASEVTRLDGEPPRSHTSSARYRARLCIDDEGLVRSVDVLRSPKRLEARIARALRGWRYLPYRDRAGARPACFDVDSRVERIVDEE